MFGAAVTGTIDECTDARVSRAGLDLVAAHVAALFSISVLAPTDVSRAGELLVGANPGTPVTAAVRLLAAHDVVRWRAIGLALPDTRIAVTLVLPLSTAGRTALMPLAHTTIGCALLVLTGAFADTGSTATAIVTADLPFAVGCAARVIVADGAVVAADINARVEGADAFAVAAFFVGAVAGAVTEATAAVVGAAVGAVTARRTAGVGEVTDFTVGTTAAGTLEEQAETLATDALLVGIAGAGTGVTAAVVDGTARHGSRIWARRCAGAADTLYAGLCVITAHVSATLIEHALARPGHAPLV